MGGQHASRDGGQGRGAPGRGGGAADLTGGLDGIFREHWWAAVAVVTRLVGDLDVAEDAVQEACAAALVQWPTSGVPASPRAWLIGVARHKALDVIRREARRAGKEAAATAQAAAAAEAAATAPPTPWAAGQLPPDDQLPPGDQLTADDQLALVLMCCHPALALPARTALTLRAVCGLSTAQIASVFLVPEATMAQRLVRAKRRIRQAGIAMKMPSPAELPGRLAAVLRVIYLVFTEGHMASSGPDLVRSEVCEQAIRLARELVRLVPGEPEPAGLLALLLLADARRPARVSPAGELVQLADQDRSRWDATRISEGRDLVAGALAARRPGPYQLQAAIAACHCDAPSAEATDWRQIVALYDALLVIEPTPVAAANRAAAVAMADGPAAGLAILAGLSAEPALAGWAPLHIAMAQLHSRLGDTIRALGEYRLALQLGGPDAQRAFIRSRMRDLGAEQR
jgi:RNA polymerase sigma-70 factor (ECF subfamily)